MPTQQTPEEARSSTADEPSDQCLLRRSREGDQDAATQLYLRYAKRLNSLVERQCSAELARRAGVEDIVQSVFGSFFRRIRQGFYDVPDGDELWKLLLVIALHKIREQGHVPSRGQARCAPDHRRRGARRHLESRADAGSSQDGYLELVLGGNPGATAPREPGDGEAPGRGL